MSVGFANTDLLRINNVSGRSEALLPLTFQSEAFRTWVTELHDPKVTCAYRFLANLLSTAAAEGISVENIAYRNLAPSMQPFLTPPDLMLCSISRRVFIDIPAPSEEPIEQCKELADMVNR